MGDLMRTAFGTPMFPQRADRGCKGKSPAFDLPAWMLRTLGPSSSALFAIHARKVLSAPCFDLTGTLSCLCVRREVLVRIDSSDESIR